MPTPDMSGVPPFAEFNDLKNKMNELVAKYNNLLVNLDSLNVVSLTADHIDSGTIDANKVTIHSDLDNGAFITIDGNGMIINNGTTDTFKADIDGNVTATSATIINDLTGTGSVSISNAGISIKNGANDTFTVDVNGAVTATSATIINDLTGTGSVSISNNGIFIKNGANDTFEADVNGAVTMTSATIQNDLTGTGSIKLDNSGLVINNGSYNTFTADINGAVSMTSATISSATGYPKVVMDPSSNLFGAYLDANDSIEIEPNYAGSPSLNFIQAGNLRGRINTLLGYPEIYGNPALAITSASTISVTGQMRFDDFTDVYDVSSTKSLQNYIDDINNDIAAINAALANKATAGASTGSGGGVFLNGGITPGTQLMVSGGGTVTWGGISVPSHTHTQT